MSTTLNATDINLAFQDLRTAWDDFAATRPGDPDHRQPVHTVYGGANLFKANTAERMSQIATASLKEYISSAQEFSDIFGIPNTSTNPLGDKVYQRVQGKIQREALEDFRIDFEDGFGNRPDDEEDAVAVQAAEQTAEGVKNNSLPPFLGIRIKPLNRELAPRATRTLDLFVTTLCGLTDNILPDNFVVTLPKITVNEQVSTLIKLFEMLETKLGMADGTLKMEFMVETPQSIIGSSGECPLSEYVKLAKGRCIGAHFGVYDYTASNNITAAHQSMDHPLCDFARLFMKNALAETGVMISDGATNIMPVGPHRAAGPDQPLSSEQVQENQDVVHRAWKLAFDHSTNSLENGIYQGWDLHPGQFIARYAAVFTFFLSGFDAAAHRLNTFIGKAAKATLIGDVFDDAATGQALLNYFIRAMACGAISEADVAASGLSLEEIRTRSFVKILKGRRT